MNTLTKFVCMMFAGAAALPSLAAAQNQPVPRVEVRQFLPLTTACPDALAVLPENLYPAWRAINGAAEVLVDFKMEGSKIRVVKMSGGYGDYVGPVRHAVKAMHCIPAGQGDYAVRFRIKFEYPEDQTSPSMAMQISDAEPGLASR